MDSKYPQNPGELKHETHFLYVKLNSSEMLEIDVESGRVVEYVQKEGQAWWDEIVWREGRR